METELKFELDAAGAKILIDHLKLDTLGQQRRLRSVYYDTPDTDLRDHGVTLRVRDDGQRLIQTVKTSARGGSGFHRGEWEHVLAAPVGGDLAPDLDLAARTPLGALLDRRELAFVRPAFEVDIERVTREVEVDGAIIEIALDRGRAQAEGQRTAIAELELELKSGPPAALFTLARTLSALKPLELSFVSKSARGYALVEDAAPAGPSDPGPRRGDTAKTAFQAIAGAALAEVATQARLLRVADSPTSLHRLRVGVRRIRSAMAVFAPMLADETREAVKAELKWLAGALNAARDLDVFIAETFQPALDREPTMTGLAGLGQRLSAARERAYAAARAAVSGPRFHTLTLSALGWIEAGDWAVGNDPLLSSLRERPIRDLADERLERQRHKVVKRGLDLKTMSPEARHKLRLKAKTLRYACGFFGGLYRGKAAEGRGGFLDAAKDLQDRLGALSDVAFSRDLVLAAAGLDDPAAAAAIDPDVAFAAGVLAERIGTRQKDDLKAAIRSHRALRKTERFWRRD